MDYTCCWDCSSNSILWGDYDLRFYLVAVLFAFDVALVVYRRWQASQLSLPAAFRIRSSVHLRRGGAGTARTAGVLERTGGRP